MFLRLGYELLYENVGLTEDGCCSLGAGETRIVTSRPDVRVLVMPEGIFIDVDITFGITKTRFSDEGGRFHWWDQMQKVEWLFFSLVTRLENRDLLIFLDLYELSF